MKYAIFVSIILSTFGWLPFIVVDEDNNDIVYSRMYAVMETTNEIDNYTLSNSFIEDNFLNDSLIDHHEGVLIDNNVGEIRLIGKMNTFNKTFGGSENDVCKDFDQTIDGGIVVVGYTRSLNDIEGDLWLIKLDNNGTEEWSITYGSKGNFESGNSIYQESNGDFVIGGSIYHEGSEWSDAWLMRTNSDGKMLWSHSFGTINYDYCSSVIPAGDGGYILFGSTSLDGMDDQRIWIIKTDKSGIMEWNSTFQGFNHGVDNPIINAFDGGYIFIATFSPRPYGETDMWLVKINDNGTMQWNRTIGGTEDDYGHAIEKTNDSGYIIVGTTLSMGDEYGDIWIVKTDPKGNMLWNRTHHRPDKHYFQSISPTKDSGYIIGGDTYVEKRYGDVWLIKINALGIIEWNKTYGGEEMDSCHSIEQTPEGDYIFIAYTSSFGAGESDFWIAKTDETGNYEQNNPAGKGIVKSSNLIENKIAYTFNYFNYSVEIPEKTSIKVQFSKNNNNWYNSFEFENEWDDLSDNLKTVDLSVLNWSGSDFYYKMELSTEDESSPAIFNINLSFTEMIQNDRTSDQENNNSITDPSEPFNFDRDDDGINDTWEISYGFNPENGSDAFEDEDQDGFSNKDEYDADTDPLDPDDFPGSNDRIEPEPNTNRNWLIIITLTIIIIFMLLGLIIYFRKKKITI